MKPPILITGAARSGTSMTAGIIDICGAQGGETCGATRWNQKGMFENTAIRKGVKQYLKDQGYCELGQNPLPEIPFNLEPWDNLRGFVSNAVRGQGIDTDHAWYYKGAKMTLMYPIWRDAFPQATWVIVRRKKEDIVNSCMKTSFMRKYTSPAGWGEWVEHHKRCFAHMRKELNTIEVWPSKFVNGDLDEIHSAILKLGLTWNEETKSKVLDFIEPALFSQKRKNNGE